jgi:hypothetical protein
MSMKQEQAEMTEGQRKQAEYEAEGGLPGKLAAGKVWRDIAVSCKCGTVDGDLVGDEPGEDLAYYRAIKALREEWQTCAACGQSHRIGLGTAR